VFEHDTCSKELVSKISNPKMSSTPIDLKAGADDRAGARV
jgi:hypothetical protein